MERIDEALDRMKKNKGRKFSMLVLNNITKEMKAINGLHVKGSSCLEVNHGKL
ncbi:hypothetical protein [Bacillus massilinigeriensis]|uniref:hypothetical protein n=1 Tax=Bacillus mediterraneensis TaxID=1805474 RepID=UPI0013564909|nr:hypothetical protein [Bacillus mediterraneensis]